MAEFFLILGLILVTAFIFVVWIIARLIGFIVRATVGIGRRPEPAPMPLGTIACGHVGCRGVNPGHARFCRRCGTSTQAAGAGVRMRYVA